MIRCKHCGYINSDGTYLCGLCGERLSPEEGSVQRAYSDAVYEQKRQAEEARKSAFKKTVIFLGIVVLIAILVICVQDSPKVDSRLTGTWRQNQWPNTTWVFTENGRLTMSVTDATDLIQGESTKYRAEDGKITAWYGSRFETVYTYQLGTVTDSSGNMHEVLVLNGGDLILFKVK